MAGRRRDAGRERLRAPAFQRRRERGLHSAGVQGEAALSVHAPPFPENGGMADRQAAAGPRRFQTADRHLSGDNKMPFEDKQAALSGSATASFLAEGAATMSTSRRSRCTSTSPMPARNAASSS